MNGHYHHIQDEINEAYRQEIGAVRRQYRRFPIWIESLHHAGRLGDEPHYYRAKVLTDDAGGGLMEGVEIRILYYEKPFYGPPEEVSQIGKLLVYDRKDNLVIFSTRERIDPHGQDPKLKLEPLVHKLLDTIRQRVTAPDLFESSALPASIIQRQFVDQFSYPDLFSEHPNLNAHQQQALEAVRTKDLSLIWGPPGTGKTEVLGRLTTELVRIGKRVLCLAVSNVAVDQFALRAARIAEGDIDPQKKFVRFGQPRLPEVIQNDYLFLTGGRLMIFGLGFKNCGNGKNRRMI
ncbi:MAG: AAA family ATPase [Saprospiraceae bacterium]|nr:AAA family ATPase [Saprospiraceae bacterium]